jgi:hypothetical protein
MDRITEIKKKKINSSELKLQLNDNYSLDILSILNGLFNFLILSIPHYRFYNPFLILTL